MAFSIYPVRKEAERLGKQKKPVQTSVRVVNLETGAEAEYPKVRRFAFSGESSVALALHRYAPEGGGKDKPEGADLIVRDLASGTDLTIGGVSEFAFDKPGLRLAWTIDVEERIGNGVSVRDLKNGTVTPLDSGKARYEKPTWNEAGDGLAVLKGTEDKAYEDGRYAVIGITDFGGVAPRKVVYDPSKDASFPEEMTISANRAPEWTEDRSGLIFGIAALKPKDNVEKETPQPGADKEKDKDAPASEKSKESSTDDKPDLVLWHWKDGRLQSQQQVQEDRDKLQLSGDLSRL